MGTIVDFPRRGEVRLTKQQVADELGFSVSWVEKQMRFGGLPFEKPGGLKGSHVRFKLSEVEAWMKRRTA